MSGKLTGNDTSLRIKEPRPSVFDTYGPDHVRGRIEKEEKQEKQSELRRRQVAEKARSRSASPDHDMEVDGDPTAQPSDEKDVSSNHSLMRVFSILFALE